MAKRLLNRRALRDQHDQAEGIEEVDGDEAVEAKPAKAPKAKAPAKPRAPRKKKAEPRVFARWAVYDGGMKQVAVFPYKERAAADAKLADLCAAKPGQFFLQVLKEAAEPEAAPAV